MKYSAYGVLAILSFSSLLFGFNSVAVTDNALSPMVNPAGLGFKRSFEGYIVSPFDTSEFRDETHLFLRAGGIGFGAELYGKGANSSNPLSTTLNMQDSLGIYWSWPDLIPSSPDLHQKNSWSRTLSVF